MSNAIVAHNTYSNNVCSTLNALDYVGGLMNTDLPFLPSPINSFATTISMGTGLVKMYNRDAGLSLPSVKHFVTNYVLKFPLLFLGIKGAVQHEFYTGCSVEQIAHAKGITPEKADRIVQKYLELNGN